MTIGCMVYSCTEINCRIIELPSKSYKPLEFMVRTIVKANDIKNYGNNFEYIPQQLSSVNGFLDMK